MFPQLFTNRSLFFVSMAMPWESDNRVLSPISRRLGFSSPEAPLRYTATCGGYCTERKSSWFSLSRAMAKARCVTFSLVLGSGSPVASFANVTIVSPMSVLYRIYIAVLRVDKDATVELDIAFRA
jgi:hypothetical protein